MNDEQAWNEQQAVNYYKQVRLYAEKHGKKPTMAYMATKEKYPSVFISKELQSAPLPTDLELDPAIEQQLMDKARAFARSKGGSNDK